MRAQYFRVLKKKKKQKHRKKIKHNTICFLISYTHNAFFFSTEEMPLFPSRWLESRQSVTADCLFYSFKVSNWSTQQDDRVTVSVQPSSDHRCLIIMCTYWTAAFHGNTRLWSHRSFNCMSADSVISCTRLQAYLNWPPPLRFTAFSHPPRPNTHKNTHKR